MSRAKIFYELWKPTDRRFKIGGVALFVAAVVDAAIVAVAYGREWAFLRPEVLAALAVVAFFYIFTAPVMMQVMYVAVYRDLQRSRTEDAVKNAIKRAVLDIALSFILIHIAMAGGINALISVAP
jgi:multisubunit Na+/H+ antiporter MnhG subunit